MSMRLCQRGHRRAKNKKCTYSWNPDLCFDTTWSPNWIWDCIPANCIASSWLTGWAPLIMASRVYTPQPHRTGGNVGEANAKAHMHDTIQIEELRINPELRILDKSG